MPKLTKPVNEFNISEFTHATFLKMKEENGTHLYQEYRKALNKYAQDYIEEKEKTKKP